ncbi:MAG: tetratricopeptide repeat protein [Endomicrobiia bacterium]
MKKIFLIFFVLFFTSFKCFAFKKSYYIYTEGLMYLYKNEYHLAIKKFEEVVRLDPEAKDVFRQLIYLYIITHNKNKIKDSIKNIEKNITDPKDLMDIANLLFLYGEKDLSKIIYEKLYSLQPNDSDVILTLAKLNFSSDTKKSVEYYKEYLKKNPDDVEVLFQLGVAEYKLGNKDEAIEIFKKVVDTQPNNYTAKLLLSSLLISSTDFLNTKEEDKEIEKFYKDIIDNNEEDYESIANLVYFLISKDSYQEAEEYIKKLIKAPKEKFLPEYNFLISIFFEYKKDFKKSAEYMEKYIRTTKTQNEELPYLKLGYYYYSLKNYKRAQQILKFVEKKFNSYKAKIMLVYLYLDTKNYKKATKILHNFEKEKSDYFNRVNFYLGLCYDQMKNFDLAEKYLLKAIEENPQDHEAMNYLGYLYAEKNINLDKAEELISKALQFEPTNYAYIDSLGWVYYKKNLYDEAERLLLKAAETQEDPVIYEHIGDVKVKLSKYEEAIEYYNKSLKINPKNKQIRKKLKIIKQRWKN